MNTSARLEFLLNPAAANTAPSINKSPNPVKTGFEFKEQFKKQIQTPVKQEKSSDNKPQAQAEEVNKKNIHAVDRNRRAAPTEAATTNEQLVSGDSLPITEEARNFLAALPKEEQQELLEGVRDWLVSLSPDELKKLQQQLAENPEDLIELVPKDLQALLAKLQNVDLEELLVPEGFTGLLAGLVNADIDFQHLAAIQMPSAVAGELKLMVGTPSAPSYVSIVRDSSSKAEAPLMLSEGKSETKQQPNEQGSSRQDKINELVNSLGKASIASANGVARSGGEAMNQLLQAAGMGLGGSQAAGAATQTVARMAAGFSSIPFMMQAAADSNAQALASRISMMNAKNMQVAEMRLDPPNLGSVRVQIRMQGEQASIIFQAPNAHARELLEQSLPKLREMMEAEGLMLADAQVSEESFSGQDPDEKEGSGQYAGSGLSSDDEAVEGMQIPVLSQPLGLIDYYA